MASKLMKACDEENITELKLLLKSSKHRKTINDLYLWTFNDSIKSPVLSYACYENTTNFIKVLLENGSSNDIQDTDGRFPIHLACFSDIDSLAKVKMLVERNVANVNRTGHYNNTPIMYVKCNYTLEYLIHKGARVNDVNEDGCSALHFAMPYNKPIIINTLLRHGADANLRDINGDTPLHVGAYKANLEAIKPLVAWPSCDVHLKNNHGETALDIARSKPHKDLDYDQVIKNLEDVVMNPVALLGTRLNSMVIACDALKVTKRGMNESQCRRCDDIKKRVLDLEKKMKQVINDKRKGDALSKRDSDLIQQLKDENRKLNEKLRQLHLELESIKSKTITGSTAENSGYSAEILAKAVRGCFDKLLKDIHCDDHAPSLFAKRALSLDEYDQVKAAVGGKTKMETMLNFLLRKKNPAWAPLFLASLKSSPACIKSVEYIEEECRRPSLAAENTIV